jgi:hypothetical protein
MPILLAATPVVRIDYHHEKKKRNDNMVKSRTFTVEKLGTERLFANRTLYHFTSRRVND